MANNKKQSYGYFFGAWIVLTIVGVILSLILPGYLFPKAMSNNQHLTILTVVIFSVAAAPVAAGVYAAVLHALRNWVVRGNKVPPAAPVQTRENSSLTIGWLLGSLVLTVFLLLWGLGALAVDNGSTGKDPLVVNVTGQQWVWTFQYAGTKVQSHELYLPLNREVEFRVTSKDVTHGFWIVQMGVQVDANDVAVTTIHTTPTKLGLFDIRCTQFCGLNHGNMVTQGHVLTQHAFNAWLASAPQAS
jgi:cytochrome c oxidase subunit II